MITPGQLRREADSKKCRLMDRQFITGAIEWRFLLTPIGSMLRYHHFEEYPSIAYCDIYIFGIRIVRWRI
jgi:hypothetical protein